jgi:hypothetical protein
VVVVAAGRGARDPRFSLLALSAVLVNAGPPFSWDHAREEYAKQAGSVHMYMQR